MVNEVLLCCARCGGSPGGFSAYAHIADLSHTNMACAQQSWVSLQPERPDRRRMRVSIVLQCSPDVLSCLREAKSLLPSDTLLFLPCTGSITREECSFVLESLDIPDNLPRTSITVRENSLLPALIHAFIAINQLPLRLSRN